MSYNNSFFPAFQFLAEPYVVFAHQPMNLPYPKGRLPQKFHWNNFRGGYGHPYYSNDWAWLSDWANCWPAWSSYVTIYDHLTIHPSSLWWFIYHSTGPATAVPMDVHPRPFLSLVTRSPFCSDTARFGLGFFARHLSMAMPAMQLCYGSMDATIETRLGAHSTTP